MSPERARRTRESFEQQLRINRDKLIILKNRRHKILKKLDKEIADVEEHISILANTIHEIDTCHFSNVPDLELDGEEVEYEYEDLL
jgi:hypothetical protein